VAGFGTKNLALILARQLASTLALPMFVVDGDGRLVFFNEPAEQLLGRSFAETGEMRAREWTSLFAPETLDGRPLSYEELPSGIAQLERRPAHARLRITTFDGHVHEISTTTLPLFVREDEFLGAMTVFWEHPAG